MNKEWRNLWKGCSYEEIANGIPSKIKEMTENFFMYDFIKNNEEQSQIAVLVVTPNQVCAAYTPGFAGKIIEHNLLVNKLLKQMNIEEDYPCIIFKCANSRRIKFCMGSFNTSEVTEEMRQVYGQIKKWSEEIRKKQPTFEHTFKKRPDPKTISKSELLNGNAQDEEQIVGIPIKEYLRLMNEQELQRTADVAQGARGMKTKNKEGNLESNEWEQSEN